MNQHTPLSNIINKLQRKELLLKLEYDYEKETFGQNPGKHIVQKYFCLFHDSVIFAGVISAPKSAST